MARFPHQGGERVDFLVAKRTLQGVQESREESNAILLGWLTKLDRPVAESIQPAEGGLAVGCTILMTFRPFHMFMAPFVDHGAGNAHDLIIGDVVHNALGKNV